ncbi:AGAP001030-PA-like protein [Anopheles sinensis]|uniref:AGAP001030-PA-like protein n=1 Tax=Anopheles sinensis TaxID=74873 RepID=A0A084VMB5_ANOSI|nr:AGAP001030-PA-like protein [Anopheles sinensis]
MIKDRLAELRSKSKYANCNLDDELDANARLSKSQEEIFENLAKVTVIRDKVEENLKESNNLCQRIYSTIKKLEVELEDDTRRTSVLFRIKHTQFIVIKDDYLSAYREHEEFVCYYEERIKDLMKLEARAMNYNITDDEAMEKLTSNQMSPFVGNILEETERERQKLRDIMTRHGQLQALEKSLMEIRDMFVRISSLVMEQVDTGEEGGGGEGEMSGLCQINCYFFFITG